MAPGLVPSPRRPGERRLLLASLTGSERRGNSIKGAQPRAATHPSRDLGDSSEPPGRRMSRPGVQGNDVTGDAAGSTSVILSLGPDGPGSCRSGDASG